MPCRLSTPSEDAHRVLDGHRSPGPVRSLPSHNPGRMQLLNTCASRDVRQVQGTLRAVGACLPIRRLAVATLAALALALLIASAAAANPPQGPVTETVQQAVGPVTGVTGAAAQTAGSAVQPVTDAVAQTTTPAAAAVQQNTAPVKEAATRLARDVEPVASEAGNTAAGVVTGAAGQALGSTPADASSSGAQRPVAHSAAPPARVQTSHAGRRHRGDTSGSRAGGPQAHSAGGDRGESRDPVTTDGPAAPAARAPFAAPVAAGSGDHAAKRVNGMGSGAPSPDMPAGAGGSASGVSSGLGLGALALLAMALYLAVPWLLQGLSAVPAARRPVLFVSLLERPG